MIQQLQDNLCTVFSNFVAPEILIFEDQDAPKPASPFWMFKIQSSRKIGMAGYSQGVNNSLQQSVFLLNEATLNIQRIGKGSESKVSELIALLQTDSAKNTLKQNKISVFNVSELVNIAYKLDNGKTEKRASVDLFVRYGSKILDNVGAIESANISGTIESENGNLISQVIID